MRDSRRARLVLALLLLTAITLITLDFRSNTGGPLREAGNAVFGPVERAVSRAVDPVGSFFSGLGHLNGYKAANARLRQRNEALLAQLRMTENDRARLAAEERLLNLAGRARFRIVAAHVVALGGAQGFESTATIDVGTLDGVHRDMTVIDGDGLVGRTIEVGPTTSTVLLANDREFTAGARVASTQQVGHVDGGARGTMTFTLLGANAQLRPGATLVTFGSIGDRPFVPEVPIGRVTRVLPTAGQLYRQGVVAPFVSFSSLSVVGVVVASPRTIPRDSLVPPSPSPSPSGTPPARSARPNRSPAPSPSPS